MTHYIRKSHLWKLTFALCVAALCLTVCIGAFAYAADGDSTVTPVEIVGLVADSNYTLVDGYWRANGGTGDYAFYQGMNIADATSRIAGVEVKMSDESTSVLPIGDDVTLTPLTSDTGNNVADSVMVPFEVKIGETDPLTGSCNINFIAEKPYALEWVSGAPDTSSLTLTASTSVANLSNIGITDTVIRLRLTSGQPGDSVMARELIAQDSLAPSGSQLPSLIADGKGTKYNKTISIAYAKEIGGQYVVDTTVSQIQLDCVNISYDDPTGISDALQGSPAIQTTKTVFNFSGLKIRLKYPRNATADIALSDIQNYITDVQFENAAGTVVSTDKNYLLTTLVKAVTITVEIPTSSGKVSQEFYVEFNVNQNVLSQPSVDNLNPTYEDGGVTVTISDILEDDDNPITMSVSGGSVTDNKISFDKGGVYTLTLTLTNGAAGDYVWALNGDGHRDDNNQYVLIYTITVSNAPVDVTLTYSGTNGADREYGDDEPAHTVAFSYAGGNEISSGLAEGIATDNTANSGLPVYELRYYPASGTTLSTPNSEVINDVTVNYTTGRPTALGTYYVYAATGATDKYAAGRSDAVKFTISARKLYTSGLTTSQPYKEGEYTVADFVNIGSSRPDGTPMFASGDTVADVINIPTTKFTHVSDSTNVSLTLKSSNYVWSTGNTSEQVAITITKVDMSFTVSQSDLTYGDKVADNLATKNISTLQFGVTIDDTLTKYEKFNGTTWTTVTAATNTVWDAGSYRVTYYTKDKASGTGGSQNNKDYNLPSATDTFVINHRTVSKVDITNWTDDNINPYLLGVYGTNYNVTLNNWLANNTSPAGAAILTSTVTGTRLDGTTAITTGITNAQMGTITINQAGEYTVTIKLNSNYKWTEDGTNDDIVLYGKIDKQTVSNAALSESNTTYDGADHNVNVTFVVGSSSASWATDSLNSNANIVNISSITGSKYAAAVLAATVTPNKTAGVVNGSFTVKYAGDYVVVLALNDTNNYEWAQGATTSFTYAVAQALFCGTYDYTDPYPFVPSNSQQSEPTFTMSAVATNDTATADVTAITPTFTLYDVDGNALVGNKVTEAGTFYKVVTNITSTDSSHLNYYVPSEDKDTADRKVSVEFVVSSAGLDKIVLAVGSTGATISDNDITVTYKHGAYKFSDFVSNWNKYYYTSGGTTIPYLDITVEGVSGYNPELTNVKIESGAVAAYVITVKPATNYEWKDNQGLSPDEEVTFTLTINQLAVELEWNNTSKDYSDNATTTVSVTNANGDDVSVNYVYVNGSSAEIAIADVKNAAAGNYTLLAKSLAGTAANNYTLTGCSNASGTSYTIYKKGIAKPATTGYTGTFNGATQTTAGLYSNASDLNTSVFTASIQGVRPADWFGTTNGIAFDTTDTTKYSYNVTTGAFTFYNAGVYSVTFTITDSANYFWQGDGNASDFTYSGSGYTYKWNDFANVDRANVSAPVLGANRAMEWTNVADLSTVFTGSVGSVSYGVQYGDFDGSYGEPQNAQAGGIGSVDSSARGEYYALLTINGDDKFNYVWTVSASDNEGSTYVTRISKLTFTSENGAQVYLHYAITASQLPVFYQLKLNGYVFGANGVSVGMNSITALGIDDLLEMTGTEADVTNAKTGAISYAFYKTGTDTQYTKLVNGLPWDAGKYDVRITITFAATSEFSTMTIRTNSDKETLTFEVSPRAIEVEWTFDNNSTLSTIFNGNKQEVNAVITNIPVSGVSEIDDATEATLTLVYKLNGSAVTPINAATYAVEIDTITGASASNFTKTGSSASDLTCSFVINPYAVTVKATSVSGHIYGNSVTNAEKASTVTSDNKFFGTDESNIKVQIWNDTLTAQYAITNNVGTYKVVPTWNGTKPTLIGEDYVINAGNYTVTVELADFTVVARQITVTFDGDKATSVYGETVDLYRDTNSVYSVTWTNKLSGQNDSGWLNGADVTTVFTLTSDATTTYQNVGSYDVTLSKVSGNNNYVITVDGNTVSNDVVLGQYDITEANITITSVVGYTGTYDNAEHAMFPMHVATTENNQTVSWYYQDVNATDKTVWTPYDLSNPAKVKNVLDSGKYYIKATAPNHNAVIYNTDGTNNEVEVTISKATIKVQINLSIWYGEQNPAALTGGAYKATVAELKSNAMYVVTGFATGESISTITGVSGDFSYTTTYSQGDNADDYDITFVNDTLTADNYVFVNNDVNTGVLTVKKLALTVTADDISTVYYSTNFAYTLFSGSVHVGLPTSTYNGATLTQADLHSDVWNKIYNSNDVFEGAQILNVTTTAYTSMQSNGVTKAVDEYTYTCDLKTDATTNYSLTSAVTAKHTITNADLEVLDSDINGYNKPYDELQHDALTKADGSALTTFANAKGGMTVSVLFIVANATDTALTDEQIAALDWANDGVSTMPTLIDVCNKVVYFRIGASNHNYAYGQRTVSVSKVENVFTNESAISFNGWTYGLYDATVNPNGYNAATYGITDAIAKFSRKDGVNGANKLHITLTRNGSAVTLDKTYEKASEMFAYMWANGLFVAGDYSLTITMDGTPNYDVLTITKTFTVAKKQLTVTADAQTLTYGDDAPEFYGYVVTGFVANKVGGAVETKDGVLGDLLAIDNALFTSDYQAGRVIGFAGTHSIYRYTDAGKTTVAGGLNDVTETDNYTLLFVDSVITVNKREVTISINDAVNRYNLSVIVDGAYTTQTAATYNYALKEGSSFFGDDAAFEIYTEAMTAASEGKRTNNAGTYPIYVRWLSYTVNGEDEISYSKNYTVKFEDCSYDGEMPADAITQDGVNCAGTYTIEKAELIVNILGPLNDDGTTATNGLVYSNTRKNYKAEVAGGDDDVEFAVTYYNGHSTVTKRDSAPIDVGNYRVVVSTDNNNYVAQTTYTDITIIPATVLVGWELIEGSETVVAQIEYGTSITALDATKSYPSNSRFTGLTYTFESEYFAHDALINLLNSAITKYHYNTTYNTTTAPSDSGVRITPVIEGSTNFTFSTEYGILQVIPRKITVQVNGWDNGNPSYATSAYTGKSPFDGSNGSWNSIKSWFTTLNQSDAYVNGHSIQSLGITLEIDGTTAYDASETPYKVNVSKGTDAVSSYYNIKFVVGDNKDAYPSTKPTYLITKKAITLTVKDQTVTYGSTINSNLAKGFEVGSLNGVTFVQYFEFSGMENTDRGMYYFDASGSADNVYKFAFDYTPYVTGVGNVTLSVDQSASTIEFTNYEVKTFVAGKITVNPRVITATTEDVIYTEAVDADGNKVYNNGVYGAAHNAAITYDGHDNGTGYLDAYVPTSTLTYTTVSTGLTAAQAPTKVGAYKVNVTLTNKNYIYDTANSNVSNNGKTLTLNFNVNKQTLNPDWIHSSIQNTEDTAPDDLQNYIADYVQSIMEIQQFQKTAMDNVVTDIHDGLDADSYQVGTVGSESVGLYITVTGTGEYRVTLTLTDAAKANYQWVDNASSVTLIFNVATDKVTISNLTISGWIYGEEANQVAFTVSNENTDGVQITYARVPQGYRAKPSDSDTDALKLWYKGLTYSASIPTDAGDYAVRAYYPAYAGVNGDEKFASFIISKATMATPTLTVADGNGAFNGEQLYATLTFDTLKVRINNYNGTTYSLTSTGATIYATDAGSYTVTFSLIDGNNYQWGSNASSATWTIDQATNNKVTFTNSEDEMSIVYGNRIAPKAEATYNGTVYFRYMEKTSDVEPERNDTNWLTTISKFVVGKYWVMAVNSGNSNYNGDYAITTFEVTKAILTITPSGSMTYGEAFSNSTLKYVISGGRVQGDNPDDIINVTGTIAYELVDADDKLNAITYGIVLKSDENGVIGMSANNYKIVSATGEFTVNKRDITVTLGNATSQYGRVINLNDVRVTYGKDELVAGDSLNLVLDTNATVSSVIGGYTITATFDNDNYNVTIVTGVYTITERRITIEMVAGGGVYGETIAPVTFAKVLDDANVDITDFVNGKLTLSVVYSGTAIDGTICDGAMPTHAGTYLATVKGSNNVNFVIVGEPFTQFVVDKKVLDGSKITIANQTYTELALEPVINNAAFAAAYGDELYDVLSYADFVNAGNHAVTLRLKDANNYKWQSVEVAEFDVTFTIDKANNELINNIVILGWIYGEYDGQVNLPTATVKFGQGAVTFVYSDSIDGIYHSGAPITGDVGEYYVRVTVPATDNYNAFESNPVKFAISKKALVIPALTLVAEGEGKNDVYTGDELLSAINGFDMALMNLNYEGKFNVNAGQVVVIAVNAGTYTVTVSIRNTNNYYFANSDENQVALKWTVAPKAVAKPTENTNRFMVNGQILTYIPEGFDEEIMTIDGNQTAYGGEFTVTVGLKDTDNYVWAEGGVDDFTLTWNVVGINTVFYIVVGVLGGASGVAVLAAGVQFLLDRRRRLAIDNAIDERSKAEAEKSGKTDKKPQPKNDENNQGGND